MHRAATIIVTIALSLNWAAPSGHAQTAQPTETSLEVPAPQEDSLEETAQPPAAPPKPIEERLEDDMVSMPNMAQALSKNLGQLHYLRQLCFGKADQTWRDHASKMMDIEAPDAGERRRSLVSAFNAGFYDQKDFHTRCGEAVSVDAAAIAENARHLASMLGDPYRE